MSTPLYIEKIIDELTKAYQKGESPYAKLDSLFPGPLTHDVILKVNHLVKKSDAEIVAYYAEATMVPGWHFIRVVDHDDSSITIRFKFDKASQLVNELCTDETAPNADSQLEMIKRALHTSPNLLDDGSTILW